MLPLRQFGTNTQAMELKICSNLVHVYHAEVRFDYDEKDMIEGTDGDVLF